jgi:deoxyribodipyrimidine photo-lyase
VVSVDGNSVVPLALLGPPVSAAAQLRPRIHRAFALAWEHRARPRPEIPRAAARPVTAPFEPAELGDLDRLLSRLPLAGGVPAVASRPGGSAAARRRLEDFAVHRLRGCAERRSVPAPPERSHASALSPYLHFGHISIEEVAERVLETAGPWTPAALRPDAVGKREGFFSRDADVNAFLDEAITWRDVGLSWHWTRREDTRSLDTALPAWALATLSRHAGDRRQHVYAREEWEAGETHDPLWNAAQRELVATGSIHNYLRMLWGKKVIEWSRTPAEAYDTLVHLNNTYGLDGRDPNSYTGILWCFGLFDRPWAPERKVLGVLRYMSSDNTARKFKLGPYLDYVSTLPTIAQLRCGGRGGEAGRAG